jgi:hypothetical protein
LFAVGTFYVALTDGRRYVCPADAASMTLSPPPPARVQIVAREYSFALSRPALNAGRAIVELVNFGEDPHDLRLQRVGGTRV